MRRLARHLVRTLSRRPGLVLLAGFLAMFLFAQFAFVLGRRPAQILIVCCGLLVCAAIVQFGRLLMKQERREAGLCLRCGYDLRATPDRCPECGAASGAARDAG